MRTSPLQNILVKTIVCNIFLCFPGEMDAFNKTQLYTSPPQVRAGDLEAGKKYHLQHISKVNTKYGPSVMARIEFEGPTDVRVIFLPKSYAQLTDSDLVNINSTPHEIILVGKHQNSYRFRLVESEIIV